MVGRNQLEGPFVAELSSFPLLVMASPSLLHFDRVSVPSFFHCVDQGLARDVRFAVLHDARAMPHADDLQRQHFMQLVDARRPDLVKHVTAYAAVVASPLERGQITAVMWFVKLPFPVRLFTTETAARTWLLGRLDAARGRDPGMPG